MKWLFRTAMLAALVTLMACSDTQTGPSASQPGTGESPDAGMAQPAVAATADSEQEKEVLAACTAIGIRLDPPSLSALQDLHGQMRCLENFLEVFPQTDHWQSAYAQRSRAVADAMALIQALSTADAAPTDMAQAQRLLMEREQLQSLKSETRHYVMRAVQEVTIDIHQSLFAELRQGGMQMGDPQQFIEESNRNAQQTGVWGVSVDHARESGQFVVTRWFSTKAPMFVIEGYGPATLLPSIEDAKFEEHGVFGEGCKVHLGVAQTRLTYDCTQYLSGTQGWEVIGAVKAAIKQDMSAKVRRSN